MKSEARLAADVEAILTEHENCGVAIHKFENNHRIAFRYVSDATIASRTRTHFFNSLNRKC